MSVLLPGTPIPASSITTTSSRPLALGPGLRLLASETLVATTAGSLSLDARKNALWLTPPSGGRYTPSVGDLVVATVARSAAESYNCTIVPHTPPAVLGQLSFEGATRKTRPQLSSGALVYARVARVEKGGEVEIECVDASTGKASGLGPLKGGVVVDVSPAFARRLMLGSKGGVVVLEELGAKVGFEIAIGRNGRVWVDAGGVRETMRVVRVIRRTEEEGLDVRAQRKVVEKVLREG
ncbi:hypothetical protein ANO11243_006910 [Dothideomycetidae sp. 11243]|nr:hypothetical protein ANO11243_006910 [fungal sp. No.11243]